MNFSRMTLWRSLLVVALVIGLTMPAASALAEEVEIDPDLGPNAVLIGFIGPRTDPHAIPHTDEVEPEAIAAAKNNLPPQASEAEDAADDQDVEDEPGILKTTTDVGVGTTLLPNANTCIDFDESDDWASLTEGTPRSDIWTDWFGGWLPFAVDDGEYYQAKNTVFTKENVVGPGVNYDDDDEHSIAIGSTEPYAGGWGSPIIQATPGAEVTVKAHYLIFNHGNDPFDWASLGIKPDARHGSAVYVNGYTRGQWSEMTNTVTAGPSGEIMVLIQGHSPTRANSKIYFDDVMISVDGTYVSGCVYE